MSNSETELFELSESVIKQIDRDEARTLFDYLRKCCHVVTETDREFYERRFSKRFAKHRITAVKSDTTPADREWFESNGFDRADDTLPVFVRRVGEVTVEAYFYKSKVSITIYDDFNAESRNYVKLMTNPTVGQLCDLIASINPTEPPR